LNKKYSFYLFLYIFIFSFSFSTNVKFKLNKAGGTILYKNLSTGNEYSLNVISKKIQTPLNPGTYRFTFYSDKGDRITETLKIFGEEKKLDIKFPRKGEGFFITSTTNKKLIKFQNRPHLKEFIPNTTITFLDKFGKNYRLDLNSRNRKINIPYGEYTIIGETENRIVFLKSKITLNKKSKKYIVLGLPSSIGKVNGRLVYKNKAIANVSLNFISENKDIYKTKSDSNGKFIIFLPKGKYRISTPQKGLSFHKTSHNIQKDSQDLKLSTSKKRQLKKNFTSKAIYNNKNKIFGKITDSKGKIIKNAEIKIKSEGGRIRRYFSNKNGKFTARVIPGATFISIEKDGYKPFGLIRNIKKNISLSMNFFLETHYYMISGYITDSVFPIKNQTIKLKNRNEKEIASTSSNEDGYYEFSNIPLLKGYYISASSKKYSSYSSDLLLFKGKHEIEHNLFMKKVGKKIHLELYRGIIPISDTVAYIDGKEYLSDSNGFIIMNTFNKNSLNLSIPKYSYKKKLNLRKNDFNPIRIEVNTR